MNSITIKDELNKNTEEREVSGDILVPSVVEVPVQSSAVWVEENSDVQENNDEQREQQQEEIVVIPVPMSQQDPSQLDYRRRSENIYYPQYDLYDQDIVSMKYSELKKVMKNFTEADEKIIKKRRAALQKRILRKRGKN